MGKGTLTLALSRVAIYFIGRSSRCFAAFHYQAGFSDTSSPRTLLRFSAARSSRPRGKGLGGVFVAAAVEVRAAKVLLGTWPHGRHLGTASRSGLLWPHYLVASMTGSDSFFEDVSVFDLFKQVGGKISTTHETLSEKGSLDRATELGGFWKKSRGPSLRHPVLLGPTNPSHHPRWNLRKLRHCRAESNHSAQWRHENNRRATAPPWSPARSHGSRACLAEGESPLNRVKWKRNEPPGSTNDGGRPVDQFFQSSEV